MDFNDAVVLLGDQCASTTYPELSDGDLQRILTSELRYVPWEAATAYDYGAVVIPTVNNGHIYRAIQGGTTAALEPTWPLYTASDSRVGTTRPNWAGDIPGSQVTDGTVIWVEAGPITVTPWDINRASFRAWRQKAAKATGDTDFRAGQLSVSQSQVVKNCLAMAMQYAPTTIT